MAVLVKLIWRFRRIKDVAFLQSCFAVWWKFVCGNAAVWQGRHGDTIGESGFTASQEREETVQSDPDDEAGWNSGERLVPHPGARQFSARGFLFTTREADLLGPLCRRS